MRHRPTGGSGAWGRPGLQGAVVAPAFRRAPGTAVPGFHRLSMSPFWAAQRRYYERAGIDAWRTATVPHHVTSNVAMATAYARIVHAFVRDTAQQGPVDVIELGAGSGRFAFLFLRALDALGPVPVRYVMTDVANSTIAWWRRHEALAPYVRAGRLAFARADAEHVEHALCDPRVVVPRSHARLSREGRVSRLVVIANYVFSGLPHDAFAIRSGRAHDLLVRLRREQGAGDGRGDEPGAWRRGGVAAAPYPEDDFNRALRAAAKGHTAEPLLFPVGALRALRRITARADVALVLVADRGTEEAAGAITIRRDLGLARHGALSFPVNFPVLRAWVASQGGAALNARVRQPLLHVAAFVLGRSGTSPMTRRAYEGAMRGGGPAAVYALRRVLTARGHHATPSALLALMARCGPDPRAIAECVRPLWPHLVDASPDLRREVARTVLDAWPNHYHVDEPDDVPFALALLLYQVRDYASAQRLFEASLRLNGEDAATWWNLGMCGVALGRPAAARAAFRRAWRLAPARHFAGLATVKTGRRASPRVR